MTRWTEPFPQNKPLPLPELHALVNQTLIKRGCSDLSTAQAFLDPDLYTPSPASEIPGLELAADRLIKCMQTGDPICVWGDFDVDGQTSTTVLTECLQSLGANVTFHIPVRQYESHGVNIENLARVIAMGAKMVVTCDTGINAVQEVEYAHSRGVEMIITDHHDLPTELPRAVAVVNPKMLPEDHPLASLAGVGVAYKLAEQLILNTPPANLKADDLLDLVAMGLVADLAVLRGDVRYLVQKGLAQLRQTKRLGLRTMMELAELNSTNLTEEHIGFALAPRLNAIGRLGDANPMVELFTTSDPIRARVTATQLEGLNMERKLRCDQVYQAAEAQLRDNPELLSQPVIVLSHAQWPGGVVGIVASRIAERYQKPAILMTSPPGQPVRGSARSIEGINITAAIAAQKDILLGFGGHPMAAGLSLEAEYLPEFRRRLWKTVQEMTGQMDDQEGHLEIDAWLNLQDANLDLAEQLEKLAPFGPGNAKLNLASHNLTLKSSTKLGKNKEHLKMIVSDEDGNSQQVLWWDGGNDEAPSGKFDLVYSLRASDWKGSRQAQLEFIDFRILEPEKIELKSRKVEILDFRGIKNPEEMLKKEMLELDTVCWAEAVDKKQVGCCNRNGLYPANTLIIWTIPPSRQELISAMEKVKPEKVIIFATDPGTDDPKVFLDRLARLLKFTLINKGGISNLSELAAATAQKEITVELGLKWLSQQGKITVHLQDDGSIQLYAGSAMPKIVSHGELEPKISALLEESKAYRAFFQKQNPLNLL